MGWGIGCASDDVVVNWRKEIESRGPEDRVSLEGTVRRRRRRKWYW